MFKVSGVMRGFETKEKKDSEGKVSIKHKVVLETEDFKFVRVGVKPEEKDLLKTKLEVGKKVELPVNVGSFKDFIFYTYVPEF